MRTRTVDVGGPLHVADFGGDGPAMVLLHGLGGSHLSWMRLGPMLAERARVYAPDMVGFGRTPPAGRSSSVWGNRRVLDRFLHEVVGTPALLVGNSMGGLISLLQAAENPGSVAGLVLMDPAVPVAPGARPEAQVSRAYALQMVPGVGEAFLRRRLERLGPEGQVRESFAVCCTDPGRVPPEVVAAHVDMVRWRASQPWAAPASLRASRSMLALLLWRRRFHAVVRRVQAPTLLLQGMDDRLITVAAALLVARRRPEWTFRPLRGIGHLPHLEDPDATAAEIGRWIEEAGREAWLAAGRGDGARDPAAP